MSVTFQVFRGSAEGKIVADKVTRTLEHNEVFVETLVSGMCGTDVHYLKAGLVLGHEGVGIVKAAGPSVTTVKVGDRVGFGYTHAICGHCDNCTNGWDQYCRTVKLYGSSDFDNGTFSSGAVWDANSVYIIPEGYESVYAAPLVCAGATVWSVLTKFGIQSTDRVAVLGIGGLGHLAIKLASALGYHVVALSSSEAKRQEAKEYGASEYHVFRSGQAPKDMEPIKHLILTGSADIDYSTLIPMMDTLSSIYPLTVTSEPSNITTLSLVTKGIRIQGSMVGSRPVIRSLLDFAAKKDIRPTIETFPLTAEGIETAMQKLRDGKMRYRGVLVKE
ncbi:alcohol dehydrogenase [Aspergillus heteromorphus CBS 117.55]|uniref:Alcohol dehydrogenase n=1 Tax=Aspergillus heteromorphus CBS 117.55 TaxID=1448321 RepID=A0A317WRE3_9EURO|nr:alcohol dehydrogenase [Aspergillus heteromorphus CBS 117.55]PWY87498.1 alcohol dehydrogenase [Aspergillus heteromorphus CBS 117.55]